MVDFIQGYINLNHLIHLVTFSIVAVLLLRQAMTQNGLTKALGLMVLSMALLSGWSVLFLFGILGEAGGMLGNATRAVAVTLTTASILYVIYAYIQDDVNGHS